MKKKISMVLGELEEKLNHASEYRQAEGILRDLSADCGDQKSREEIRQVRKILRRQRRRVKSMFYRGCFAVWAVAAVAVTIWALRFFIYVGKMAVRTERPAERVEKSVDTEPETETQEETEKTQTELQMSFTGDFILGTDEFFAWDTSLNAYHDLYGGEYFLQNVRDIFLQDDLTVINMEGTLTEETVRLDKQFAFKGPPEFIDILSGSSIEAANVANNHSHDYGEKSFRDTVERLESAGIAVFGYDQVQVLNVKGIRVGLSGIYELDDHLERIPQLKENIRKLKRQDVDVIVAVFHWGNELERVPDSNQTALAHLAIDEGADLVIGHHPHVVQGIESYKGKNIVYSLGNFCFGGNTRPTDMDTMIFQQTFLFNSQKEIVDSKINIIPCSVSSEINYNDYRPRVLTGQEAQEVLDKVKERSDAIPQT